MTTRKNKYNKRFRKTRSKRGGGQLFSQPESSSPPPPPPVCPICTEVVKEPSFTTQCGHIFDKDCIREWCRRHREETECPLCRAPIGRLCRELLFTELEKILFDAIWSGEIDIAEEALQSGMDDTGETLHPELLNINIKDKNGYTPLMLAASHKDVEMVKLLLHCGADVNMFNAYRVTNNDEILNWIAWYKHNDDPLDRAVEHHLNRGGKRKTRRSKKSKKSKKSKRKSITKMGSKIYITL